MSKKKQEAPVDEMTDVFETGKPAHGADVDADALKVLEEEKKGEDNA